MMILMVVTMMVTNMNDHDGDEADNDGDDDAHSSVDETCTGLIRYTAYSRLVLTVPRRCSRL